MIKNSKKILALICALVMCVSLVPVTASAYVTGYAQPTDIVATINGYQLESYNVNGHTYICVEDLRYYGFDVIYDNYTRTLSVNRNYYTTWIDPQNTNPEFWSIGTNNTTKNILYTDISTYVNGYYVASSNINGKTIINFNELSRFGAVNYDNNLREISLTMDDVNYNQLALCAQYMNNNADYNESWKLLFRSKGDVLYVIGTIRHLNATDSDLMAYLNSKLEEDKSSFRESLYTLQSSGIPVSSIYVEYRRANGSYFYSFQLQ